MSEKTCPDCIRWFECQYVGNRYNSKTHEYNTCEFFATDERLEGRIAKCQDCGEREPSRPSLPFFWYRPDKDFDSYYCGCYGWD